MGKRTPAIALMRRSAVTGADCIGGMYMIPDSIL